MGADKKKSKKQSVTKAELLLETTIFFIDRCLGRQLGESLRAVGLNIELHDDHFPDTTEDAAWLPVVGQRGWAVLTKDKAIRRNQVERESLIQAGVRMFAISGNLTSAEMAELVSTNKLKIARFLKNHEAPFVARISKSEVVLLFNY